MSEAHTPGLPQRPGQGPRVATVRSALEQDPLPIPGEVITHSQGLTWDDEHIEVRVYESGDTLRIDYTMPTTLQVARATYDRRNWMARILRRPKQLEQRLFVELRTRMARFRFCAAPGESRLLAGLPMTHPQGEVMPFDRLWDLIQTARSLGARLEIEPPRVSSPLLQSVSGGASQPSSSTSSGAMPAVSRLEGMWGEEPVVIRNGDALWALLAHLEEASFVRLGRGTYRLPRGVVLDHAVKLRGSGARRTILEIPGSFVADAGLVLEDLSLKRVQKAPGSALEIRSGELIMQRCRVSGGRDQPDGAGSTGHGIAVGSDASSVRLERCHIFDNLGHGVCVDGGSVWIQECRFDTNVGAGLVMQGDATGTARTNQSMENGRAGMVVAGAASVRVEHNTLKGNRGDGLVLSTSSTSLRIRDNTVTDNRGDGVHLLGQSSVELEGNRLTGNSGCGLHVEDMASVRGHDNSLLDNRGSGAQIQGSSRLEMQQVTAKGNRHHGFWARERAELWLESCTASTNVSSGIAMSDHSTGGITGSTCDDNQEVGLRLEGHAQARCDRNSCKGNTSAGILIAGEARGELHENHCVANRGDGILLTAKARGVIERNHILDNVGRGLHVGAASHAVAVSGNRVGNNAGDSLLHKILKG